MPHSISDSNVQIIIRAISDAAANPSHAIDGRAKAEQWLLELELGAVSMSEEARKALTAALED